MRRTAAALALVAVAAAAIGTLRTAPVDPPGQRVENALLDLRFRLRGTLVPPTKLAIVAIDEATLARFPGTGEIRAALAVALDRARDAGAAGFALDLLLLESSGADEDLARAMARLPHVVMASGASAGDAGIAAPPPDESLQSLGRSLFPVVAGRARPHATGGALLLPQPRFAPLGLIGHVNIPRADDRVARQALVAIPVAEGEVHGFLPTLPLSDVRLALGIQPGAFALWPGERVAIGPHVLPTGPDGTVTLNHYGPAGTIPTIGLGELVAGETPPDALRGRLVLFGATAESLRDVFATPFGSNVPGVEVLATFAGNVMDGSLIRRDRVADAVTVALCIALAGFAMAAALPAAPALGLGLTSAVWLAGAGSLIAAFGAWGLWLDGVAVLGSLAVGSGTGASLRERAQRDRSARLAREKANIIRYLPAGLVGALADSERPAFDRRRQDCAVLFVDVAGYTSRAERQDPVAVAEFLAQLHADFEEIAVRHGGVVVDFLGDGAMIVFGLPDPAPTDAAAAIACGRDFADYRGTAGGFGGPPLALRVSVHCGPVAAAILGGRRQAHATVTGDTVNLAARLQEIAKHHGARFVVSRAALDAAVGPAGGQPPDFAFLTVELPRGRESRVEVWAYSPAPPPAETHAP
ncbi:adenylate/guanylate cyclase domain-containing protein [Limibaculum sp. FT325]|uniref:CHASE2 domain-containing protein n=1 Tax=Thermohalobaculum sediminis TaxID=2939436 RepID=UPI0020C05193|nr:adenylate/guanylate cyclase domain-containing protein [Limibaculum sediminis]MCL5776168.1 adenylate/guanylate cyclase domain-containing protein [Limibaculum sediminis]